jgi:hypothetical protein
LIKVSKDESSNKISENLRAHVEGPEKSKVKAFVRLDGTVRDIGTRCWLADSFSQSVEKGSQENDEIYEPIR